MKIKLLFLFVLISNYINAQTSFDKGFQSGYKNGYCYNQNISCIPPIPPITPIPRIGEDLNNYQDGYNRGFETGLSKQKEEKSNNANYNSSNTNDVSVDFMYKPNYEMMKSALEAVDNRITENLKYREALIDWTLDLKLKKTDNIFIEKINAINSKLINMNPENDYVGFSKKQGDLDKIKMEIKIAINEYNLRLKNKPEEKNEDAYVQEMKKLYEDKEYEKIIRKLDPLANAISKGTLKDNNAKSFYYYHLANCNYNLQNWNEAIVACSKYIEINNPNSGDVYFIRAVSKSNIEDYYGSISDYNYIIENYNTINYKSNNLATLYNNKAYNLIKLNNLKDAKPLIDKAIQLDKSKWYIWDTKGELAYKLGNYSECITSMSEVIKLNPTENSLYYRGLAYIKKGQKDKGCIDLSKAGELGNKNAYTEIKTYCK